MLKAGTKRTKRRVVEPVERKLRANLDDEDAVDSSGDDATESQEVNRYYPMWFVKRIEVTTRSGTLDCIPKLSGTVPTDRRGD